MRFPAIAAGGCLLVGCAALNDGPGAAKARIPPPAVTGAAACFYTREVQNFRVLDRSNLIVYAPNDSTAYHVRINPPSSQLRYAESLAFVSSDGRICGYGGDRLIVGVGAGAERVGVFDVSRLAPDSLEALKASSAGQAPSPARPQQGPGAEIEGANDHEATGAAAEQAASESGSPPEK